MKDIQSEWYNSADDDTTIDSLAGDLLLNLDEPSSEDDNTEDYVEGKKHNRSNSVSIDSNGTPSPIKYEQRNLTTNEKTEKKNPMKDALIINVISLEAGAKYHTKFHQKLSNDKLFNHNKKGRITTNVINMLKNLVNYTSSNSYACAFSELLRNKEPAHCIAVLEGSKENLPSSFTAEDAKHKKHTYIQQNFELTLNDAIGRKDKKQGMTFYVRQCMENVFTFKKTEITIKVDKFSVAEIGFSTVNGQQFGILVVHIPNKHTTSQEQANIVNDAIERYAKSVESKINIVCYLGDTNFKKLMQPNSSPSIGGHQCGNYLSPTSSSNDKHTDFMQAVSLLKSPKVIVNQPSTLNLVKIEGEKATTPFKTDHPSIQTILQFDALIKGKPERKESVRRGLFLTNGTKETDSTHLYKSETNNIPTNDNSISAPPTYTPKFFNNTTPPVEIKSATSQRKPTNILESKTNKLGQDVSPLIV